MNPLNEDLDDSALTCMSLIQKRKASGNGNPRKPKQTKLDCTVNCTETQELRENNITDLQICQDSEVKLNESISRYFVNDKNINTCPLCLKSFESDSSYLAHMKQCAKKRHLTTQQLLGALKLQKEQMEQKRMLGLCSQIVPGTRKTTERKKVDGNTDKYNLALGLALSESLCTTDNSEDLKFKCNNVPGPSRKRGKSNKTCVLRERTAEERQRIMTEKAAVVLLDEDQENKVERKKLSVYCSLDNIQLANLQDPVSVLWKLGENEMTSGWYVNTIKDLLLTEMNNRESKLTAPEDKDIESEIMRLNLPEEDFYQDWRKMIDNSELSDFKGKTKDCQTFYLHSLVLLARCPEILEKDYESVFQTFNKSTVLIFLEYLYCGTLNGLIRTEVKDLLSLATSLNYEKLVKVLNQLQVDLSEDVNDTILSNSTMKWNEMKIDEKSQEDKIAIVENKEDEDLFENLVDLTQNSNSTFLEDEDGEKLSGNESNAEKSYWSFIQHEKEKENLEQLKRQEEENENTIIGAEMEKIEMRIEERDKMMEKLSNEYEVEEDLKSEVELGKISRSRNRDSSDSATKDLDEFLQSDLKMNYECVVISSDSETFASKPEEEKVGKSPEELPLPGDFEYEAPYFDPYDNLNNLSDRYSPVGGNWGSQSLITGNVSSVSPKGNDSIQEKPIETGEKILKYFSTPVSKRRTSRIKSGCKISAEKSRKRRSDLSSSRILRKSLGLEMKMRNSRSNSVKKKKNKSFAEAKEFAVLTKSVLSELSNSPLMKCSTPLRNNSVNTTPISGKDDFGESVTPFPNYSGMGETLLKDHLSKYGLKKTLPKSKAKKILRLIYEELHPLLNKETGEIVKTLPNDTPKGRKQTKRKTQTREGKSKKSVNAKQTKRDFFRQKQTENDLNSSRGSDQMSVRTAESLDGSTDYDSGGSEFEDLNEPLTQSIPSNKVDLPSAFSKFLEINPGFHQKILLYEPIWIEELQRNLKETFKKCFKLSDLRDFLDQMCITFRSEAQKRRNQIRNNQKKSSPKKKKSSSS